MADNQAVQRENIPLRAAAAEIRKKKGLPDPQDYEEIVKSLSPETQAKLARTIQPPSSYQPKYGAGQKPEYNPETDVPGTYLEGDRYLRVKEGFPERGNRLGERVKRLFGRK